MMILRRAKQPATNLWGVDSSECKCVRRLHATLRDRLLASVEV